MGQSRESAYVPALRFRRLTPFYDTVVRLTTRERTFKRALVQQASIAPGHHVLDLGCGTGTLALSIKEAYPTATVVGVDGDAAVLSLAVRKAYEAGLPVRFDRAMSHSLPYPDAHFDRVVSSLFFHHLSRDAKTSAMREMHRVLKPDGEAHVADWGRAANGLMRALFVPIQLLDGFANTQDNVCGRLWGLLEVSGFARVSQRRTFSTMFGTMALYSATKPQPPWTRDGQHRP